MRKQRASALLRVQALPPRRVPLEARFTPLGNVPKTATTSASERKPEVQWPPPRRRVVTGDSGTSLASVGVRPAVGTALPKTLEEEDGDGSEGSANDGGSFDGLRAAGAFGTATLIVFATATVAVWGVRTHLEVDNVHNHSTYLASKLRLAHCACGLSSCLPRHIMEEFSRHMRYWVATKLSWLSVRINRQLSPDSPAEPSSPPSASPTASKDRPTEEVEPWTWDGAAARLGHALDSGGAYAWGEAVGRELEAEAEKGRLEREALVKAGAKSRN
ncbi:hypothetical protein FIBSPDRAFT_870823 [Athelia psychrophila]|uniref:Uncharacterized protein n=1 Tax=Athelia psychrophila TaxID=1759441 RepID=A0A166ATC7_9AGAM|nr:hypothetical protein FIBSPDRAFT_870823 [Fibularhizoctonia sp. CBS 109695]